VQTGQVSIWVPIIVGVIGLIGVISGQLVNAWREDRRWRRDQDREEVRWKREREKEEMKLAHDSLIDLRDKRIDLFAFYIQSVHAVALLANKLGNVQSIEAIEEIKVEYDQRRSASEEACQAVRITASDQVLVYLKSNALVLFQGFTHRYVMPFMATEEEKKSKREEELKDYKDKQRKHGERIWNYYHQLIDLVRADLGIITLEIRSK
jgi:hypothetical protein